MRLTRAPTATREEEEPRKRQRHADVELHGVLHAQTPSPISGNAMKISAARAPPTLPEFAFQNIQQGAEVPTQPMFHVGNRFSSAMLLSKFAHLPLAP
jgi:hypothetical protein